MRASLLASATAATVCGRRLATVRAQVRRSSGSDSTAPARIADRAP
jgi:hypothetical protein